MAVTFDRSMELGVIRLEGEVDIAAAAELKQVLLEALASGPGARISVEKATGIDITVVQLLWAAEHQAPGPAAVLALEGRVPETLRTAVREAGFHRFPLLDAQGWEVGVR